MKREYWEAMDSIRVPEACQNRVMAALEKKTGRRPRRLGRLLLAAALVCGMTVSAVALSPRLREYIFGAAGPFSPYVRPAGSAVVTVDGYEAEVVSVVADHYLIVAYVELRDMEGCRLQEGDNVWGAFKQTAPEGVGVTGAILGGEIIRCEEDGKTALAAVMTWGGHSVGNPNVTLRIFKPMDCEIPVTLEYVPIQTIDLSGLDTGGALPRMDRLELSPLGVNGVTRYKENATAENTQDHERLRGALTVYFEDGSQRVSVRNTLTGSFDLAVGSWLFMDPYHPVQPEEVEPLDVEGIVGISCRDWYIPISNGQAGPVQQIQP